MEPRASSGLLTSWAGRVAEGVVVRRGLAQGNYPLATSISHALFVR
jgi:hypothetical protein